MQKMILPINMCKLTASWKTDEYKKKFGFTHYGIDMVSTGGDSTIYASGNGTVVAAGRDNIVGNMVAVRYPEAWNRTTEKVQDVIFRYFHMESIAVKEGQSVSRGAALGVYGNTGQYSTGLHLHLEVDTDTKNILHSPTVKLSNFIKGSADPTLAANDKSMSNPLGWLHCKTDAPDNQTYTTTGDDYIRVEDKTIATIILEPGPIESDFRLEGIDVSRHNGIIDWFKVKAAGKKFAFIKVGNAGYDGRLTNWDKGIDSRFHENMKGALAAGIHVGVYVYSYCKTPGAAAVAARETLELVKPYKITYPIAFDIESVSKNEPNGALYDKMPRDTNSAIAEAFLSVIEKVGYYALLYTYKSFAEYCLNMSQLAAYDVWIAQYANTCTYQGAYGIWQHHGDKQSNHPAGSCLGVTGVCDLDTAYRDYARIIREKGLNNPNSV